MRTPEQPTVSPNPASKVKVGYALIPICIGLAVVGYMLGREFNPEAFAQIQLTWSSALWVLAALLLMLGRDLGYTLRLMTLSGGKIPFGRAFRVIMLWEFTSAITPSAVGGTSVAVVYVNKEGLSVGESSAVVMATSFLDELYFVLVFPIMLLLVGQARLFGVDSALAHELMLFCWIGYSVKLGWTLLMAYGLFINPQGLSWLIAKIFQLPLLRRWQAGAHRAGNDIVLSSGEFRRKPFTFWLKAFGSTAFSWTSRFGVVNALLLAFFAVGEHLVIFARQLNMWIIMLVSPTPGGSGFAEYVFKQYLSEFIPLDALAAGGVATAFALLWRMVSYYPYLFIGAVLFPRWVSQKFGSRRR
ncbi:MAG: flippase-like domain-containing protein [Bacteroidales bacterium]|nr:flippase-like domain-containing protein [Bacteroidales bacterium]